MAIELGHFALILAFAIAAASAVFGLWGWQRSDRVGLMLRQGAVLQFLLVAAAFGALIQAFVVSDFSLALAWQHSHSAQPLLFKITSVHGRTQRAHAASILPLISAAIAKLKQTENPT
jgi:cytochrome c-type biogenesis protein CcmF